MSSSLPGLDPDRWAMSVALALADPRKLLRPLLSVCTSQSLGGIRNVLCLLLPGPTWQSLGERTSRAAHRSPDLVLPFHCYTEWVLA